MRPSTAWSWSGATPRAGATAANSLLRALVVDFSVDGETPPMVVEPPDAPSGRIAVVTDAQVDRAERQSQRFGRDHGDGGAGSGAEILGAHLDHHGAVRVDGGAALAGVSAAAPGVDCEAEALLDRVP